MEGHRGRTTITKSGRPRALQDKKTAEMTCCVNPAVFGS
jgi:hypothetical protein